MKKLLNQANDLLILWRTVGPATPAIDLKLMFRELVLPKSNGDKCCIVEEDFKSFEGLMALDEETGEYRIGVSTNIEHLPRRNFTLAHEIGHFIGHRHLRKKFQCSFENINDYQNDELEIEANQFAAHLLMPPDVIREFAKELEFNHENVKEIALKLNVSKSALAYRWVELTQKPVGFVVSRDGMYCSGRASDTLYSKGTYFHSGDEVPVSSNVFSLKEAGIHSSSIIGPGVWNQNEGCKESSYATEINGYVYTYLDFAA